MERKKGISKKKSSILNEEVVDNPSIVNSSVKKGRINI